MIKSDTMYEFYTADITVKLEKAISKKEELEKILNGLVKLLELSRDELNAYCSVKYDELLKYDTLEKIKEVKFPNYDIYSNGAKVNTKAIKMYAERYIKVHYNYKRAKSTIARYRKERIPLKMYKKIIVAFNKKMVEQIINHNYSFNMVPSFGKIEVIKSYSKRKLVDWGNSTKNKKAILARGGIPYIKADAEADPNYKGEKWLVHHPNPNYYVNWTKIKFILEPRPYLRHYTYEPARGVNSIVSKLTDVKRDPERASKLYNRTRHE